jgi:hypothetical protein
MLPSKETCSFCDEINIKICVEKNEAKRNLLKVNKVEQEIV